MHSYKKVFFFTLGMSLAVHVAVLSMPVLFRAQTGIGKEEGIVTVDLKRAPAVGQPLPVSQDGDGRKPAEAKHRGNPDGATHEETVAMGSHAGKYRNYLKKVKIRIDSRWIYPGKAFERGENGVTTVRFSINNDGSLAANTITGSSGYNLLDECALNVIRSAAPYDPLPGEYNLSRLHIIASFHYNLAR